MTENDIVITDLDGNIIDGNIIDGNFFPSSDFPTHLYLYKVFGSITAVVHTHSNVATSFAQAGKEIIAFGATHADAFYGNIPVTRALTEAEVKDNYEENTGKIIAETFIDKDYSSIPAVIVKNHGTFVWGNSANDAVDNAFILEEVAKMCLQTITINKNATKVDKYLLDKHYYRKHGKKAFYGQKKV